MVRCMAWVLTTVPRYSVVVLEGGLPVVHVYQDLLLLRDRAVVCCIIIHTTTADYSVPPVLLALEAATAVD